MLFKGPFHSKLLSISTFYIGSTDYIKLAFCWCLFAAALYSEAGVDQAVESNLFPESGFRAFCQVLGLTFLTGHRMLYESTSN